MMQNQTLIEMARELRLAGFADALELHSDNPSIDQLPFSERLGMLFLAEREKRHDNLINRLLKDAKLKLTAVPEEANMSPGRGLDPAKSRTSARCLKGIRMGKKLNPMAIKRAWVYDSDELAHALGVSTATIRNMMRRGMPVMAGRTPYLFIGEAVREFIRSERADNKQPLAIDQLFCPSCRGGQRTLDMAVSLVHINAKTSRLEGLCECCECRANRTIKVTRISEFAAIFDITERAMSET